MKDFKVIDVGEAFLANVQEFVEGLNGAADYDNEEEDPEQQKDNYQKEDVEKEVE